MWGVKHSGKEECRIFRIALAKLPSIVKKRAWRDEEINSWAKQRKTF